MMQVVAVIIALALAGCSGVSVLETAHGRMETWRDYDGFGPVAVACRQYDNHGKLIGLGCFALPSPAASLAGSLVNAGGLVAGGALIGAGLKGIDPSAAVTLEVPVLP